MDIFMRKNYEIPEISVIHFDNEDIVTTSTLSDIASKTKTFSDNEIAWDILNH